MDKNPKTGNAVCPKGSLLNHDGDEQRATPLSDGRVFCVLCGVGNPLGDQDDAVRRLPALIKSVIAELITVSQRDEEAFKVSGVSGGGGREQDKFRLAHVEEGHGHGAVAQGFGPEDVGTTVSLTLGRYSDVKVEVSFSGHDIKSAENGEAIGQTYSRGLFKVIVPIGVDQAAQKLTKLGFYLVSSSVDGMLRRLTLVKGRKIPGKDTIIGVRAQVSWIVN